MIHPTAVVHSGAEVGEGATIGPYAVIGDGVHIGADTTIGPHVVINGPTRIGARNRIFQFASIGEIPQDKKFKDETTELVVGDDNLIREFVTINRGTTQGGGATRVGNGNWIMAYVHIAHDCEVGDDVTFSNGTSLAGHVQVDDHAVLSGFTLVHQFCRIGRHAFTGMGSHVNRDVPPFVLASGAYARAVGINKEGLKRHGFDAQRIRDIYRAFKTVLRGSDLKADLHTLEEACVGQADVQQFIDFIRASERGVVR